jgi:hypothetical protein
MAEKDGGAECEGIHVLTRCCVDLLLDLGNRKSRLMEEREGGMKGWRG